MSHKYLPRAAILLALCAAAPRTAPAQFATPSPAPAGPTPTPLALSARAHTDELARAEAAMRDTEASSKRTFAPLDGLENPRAVTRRDGASQAVSGDEWRQRREDAVSTDAGDGTAKVARSEAREVREALGQRRQAVEEWAFPPGSKYFAPDAGARGAVLEWEKSGIIQTGPPAWQQAWLRFVRWVYATIGQLSDWLSKLLTRAPAVQPTPIDTKKVQLFFYLVLAGILAGAAFLTWRALGGHVRRGRRGARDVMLEGEDAALLRLPPDELLDRARQFAQAGNFREALRHRYLSLLLLLDARGVWRYDRRRTNWEHIARLKSANASREGVAALSELTLRFDRVRYGNESCDQNLWLHFDQGAQSTLQVLAGSPGSSGSEAVREEARG